MERKREDIIMTQFWRSYFIIWVASIGLFGAVLAGGAFEATSAPVRFVLTSLNGPGDLTFTPVLRFSLALMGAAGRPLWNAITAGMVTWFVIDCSLSIATGFGLNVVPNSVLAGMYLVGLRASGALKQTQA
jgi:hypothetical protein